MTIESSQSVDSIVYDNGHRKNILYLMIVKAPGLVAEDGEKG